MPSRDGPTLLEARGLQRRFGRVPILHGIDLALRAGEALAIVGPNGAGKTTLLRLLAGLIRPTAGQVLLQDQPLRSTGDRARRGIGFLSHQSLLYNDLTLLENLTFAARLQGLANPRETARQGLEAAGLAERAGDLPARLSRGLLQRAALARALLHDPAVLLLDEPFTGLDAAAAERLRATLDSHLTRGHGLVLVTHNLADSWQLATRLAVLHRGRWVVDEARTGSLEMFLARYQELTRG